MLDIPNSQVLARLKQENPWWIKGEGVGEKFGKLQRREYFSLFYKRMLQRSPHRALVLMGPRRVGKTVLLHHAIAELLRTGTPPSHICYVSVDHPLYTGSSLEQLVESFAQATGCNWKDEESFIFFDEIQYLRMWEQHLKRMVDDSQKVKLIASGSAAAALKLKSTESGAGRFSDFLLPPLTFHEYVSLLKQNAMVEDPQERGFPVVKDIESFNKVFIDYLNFGGYPEVALSKTIQSDPAQFLKSDIIDKVLLRDLPSLYGIQDIQELNHLFTTLAYNTANEVSLEGLSKKSGVAKNTIKRYIEYLEAAFLIKTVNRLDRSARRFQRQNFFKVYLTNPSIRSALFSPVDQEDDAIGSLAETAAFAQWFHSSAVLHYARWAQGEVDIVNLHGSRLSWATEVKWSDRYIENREELAQLVLFAKEHRLGKVIVTSKTTHQRARIDGVIVQFVPVSIYCYTVGRNVVVAKDSHDLLEDNADSADASTEGEDP